MANDKIGVMDTYDDGGNLQCKGFDSQDRAIEFIDQSVRNEDFTEADIRYKGDAFSVSSRTGLAVFYNNIFQGRRIRFKDYLLEVKITNDTGFSVGNGQYGGSAVMTDYEMTYSSLMEHLNMPKYIVVFYPR